MIKCCDNKIINILEKKIMNNYSLYVSFERGADAFVFFYLWYLSFLFFHLRSFILLKWLVQSTSTMHFPRWRTERRVAEIDSDAVDEGGGSDAQMCCGRYAWDRVEFREFYLLMIPTLLTFVCRMGMNLTDLALLDICLTTTTFQVPRAKIF